VHTAHNQDIHFTLLCRHRIPNITASIICKLFLYTIYAKLQTYKCKVCTHYLKNIFITECKLNYFCQYLFFSICAKIKQIQTPVPTMSLLNWSCFKVQLFILKITIPEETLKKA